MMIWMREAELIVFQHSCNYYQFQIKVGHFLWEKQHKSVTQVH